jgi:sugar phosphate isomerase/epimerase
MKISITVQTPEVASPSPVSLLTGDFEETLAKAERLGVDGLELLPIDPATLVADSVRESLARHRLEAAAIGTVLLGFAGITLLHADEEVAAQAQGRLHDMIHFASAVGAPLVTIGGFRGSVVSVGEEGPERLARVLHQAAARAAERNVRLAFEPINHFQTDFVTTAEAGLAFLQKVDHPAAGLLLDTCHMNVDESSWDGPIHTAMAAGRLWHVHVADNNRLAPGKGLIDFGAIVDCLREAGYAGYLSAEVLAKPDPDTAARDAVSHMRAVLESG